jgi:hypothetical protein
MTKKQRRQRKLDAYKWWVVMVVCSGKPLFLPVFRTREEAEAFSDGRWFIAPLHVMMVVAANSVERLPL